MGILLQMDSVLFLGRFHPLVVHLPIGFLLLAGVFFGLSFIKKFSFLTKVLPIVLFFGALSAILAVVLGLFLANEGGYDAVTLGWHQWMGISVAVICVMGLFWLVEINTIKTFSLERVEGRLKNNNKYVGIVMVLLMLLISVTGHLGGNLTHGDQYLLKYAPEFLQTFFDDAESNDLNFPVDPDSVLVYEHLIVPILIKKCASCHNENDRKGGLNVTTWEDLLSGGENGTVLERGAPLSSELFKRVSLDPESKKFMPPKGAPLSYGEVLLVEFWIKNDLSRELAVTDENITPAIKALIEQQYAISTSKKSFIEKEKVMKAEEKALASLRSRGFQINQLGEDTNFLEVVAKDSVTKEKIEALLMVSDQVTWLDLSSSGMQDAWMETVGSLKNLTRLELDGNPLSEAGIIFLEPLEHLESLNLHSTKVNDKALLKLVRLSELKRLYLWNTLVSNETADSIKKQHPTLALDLGVSILPNESRPAK